MFDAIAAARARGDRRRAGRHRRAPADAAAPDGGAPQGPARDRARREPGAPHETLLVLDANTGQNALAQVAAFDAALGLTGLILTKLDGSAKGGVVAAIAKQHPVPLQVHRRRRRGRRPAAFRAARVRRRAARLKPQRLTRSAVVRCASAHVTRRRRPRATVRSTRTTGAAIASDAFGRTGSELPRRPPTGRQYPSQSVGNFGRALALCNAEC